MALNPLTCPACGAECEPGTASLDGWDDDLSGGYVFVDFVCPACKTEYSNTYRLESQEVTYRPGED